MAHWDNIVSIRAVYNALKPLNRNYVFVGGATVSLYAQRDTKDVRPTEDVDVVVEVLGYNSDYESIIEKLLQIGFQPDVMSGVICRYLYGNLTVDIMTTENVMGFSNRWYANGFKHAIDYRIDDQHEVKIFSAPYFIASKFEAFKNRGKNDGRTSTDFEDIVFLLENRETLWEEINAAPVDVHQYIKEKFTELINNPNHEEWIGCHVDFGSPPNTYLILNRIKEFVEGD